mgnify:CR=1 FL=1|jgi:chorismate mutase
MSLENWRKQIDEIDAQIVALLNRRAEAAGEIARIKTRAGLPIIDLERESEVMANILSGGEKNVLNEWQIATIYQNILRASRQVQVNVVSEMTRAGEAAS